MNPFLLANMGSFDYVVIQESAVMSEPIAIGPALMGKTLILFGDHYITGPQVKSTEADKAGMSIPLFR